MTEPKRIAILTGGGDVPGPQRRHQERRLPRDRGRLHGPRHPPRLGGPDPPAARREPTTRTTSGRSTGSTPGRSSGPAARSCTRPGRTRARCARAGLPPWMDEAQRARYAVGDDLYDLTPLVLDNLARARRRRAGDHRRRRHAVVLAGPGQRRRAARGDPQDDGQRRPGHRVLHRLLDRDHPGQGGDQPPADDARQPRADRRLPDLRARRRVLGAVHGLRDVGALRHPRGAVRPRRAGRAARGRSRARTRATTPS